MNEVIDLRCPYCSSIMLIRKHPDGIMIKCPNHLSIAGEDLFECAKRLEEIKKTEHPKKK